MKKFWDTLKQKNSKRLNFPPVPNMQVLCGAQHPVE